MRSGRRKRTSVIVFAAEFAVWALLATPAFGQRGPALVEVTPVISRQVAAGQTVVGTITPTQRAVIGSAVDGRVVEIFVEEGDRVESGAAMAQLLTETINLELEAAEAELELYRQQQAELENGSRPEEIEQARARMKAAEALVDFLKSERVRLEQLIRKGATSASEFEQAISQAIEAQERFAEARASYELAVAGPRVEQIAQARAQTARQEAVVRRLKDQMAKHTVISRFAGYVTLKQSEIGQWVTRGDPVVEVVALDEVDVIAKVVESHVPYIHRGDSVRVEVPALPDQVLTGTVVAVIPQADVRSRTFPVKVRVDNQMREGELMLQAGMLARVTLQTGTVQNALLVPKDALVLGGPTPQVWTIDPASIQNLQKPTGEMLQGHAIPVSVQLGVADGDLIQVEGQLAEGALVIVKGNERIAPPRPNQPSVVTWSPASSTTPPNTPNSASREG